MLSFLDHSLRATHLVREDQFSCLSHYESEAQNTENILKRRRSLTQGLWWCCDLLLCKVPIDQGWKLLKHIRCVINMKLYSAKDSLLKYNIHRILCCDKLSGSGEVLCQLILKYCVELCWQMIISCVGTHEKDLRCCLPAGDVIIWSSLKFLEKLKMPVKYFG